MLVLASWSQLVHALLTLGILLEDSYLIQSLSNVLLFIVLQGKGEGGGREEIEGEGEGEGGKRSKYTVGVIT